tara:strand:- start:3827 stop:4282 length:456 start_codon:yes stop_codon:yes gene_type:complete
MSQKPTPFERYEALIKELKNKKQPLPVNQFGDVNFKQIADACNNRRQWFSENANKLMPNGKTLKATIAFDAETLGTAIVESERANITASTELDELRKENNKLKRARDINIGEINRLRKENAQLKALIEINKEEATNLFDEIMESGRSFSCR